MKISFVVPHFFKKGRIFCKTDPISNRDNCLQPFISLRDELNCRNIEIATNDQLPIDSADSVLCLDMPKANNSMWQDAALRSLPVHVIALESDLIHRENSAPELVDRCKTIFTPNDSRIDYVKYFPIRFAQEIRSPLRNSWGERRFACMIAGNKASSDLSELYSRRIAVISWYCAYQPDLFDLYGAGWNSPTPSNILARIIGRMPLICSAYSPNFSVYRGTIKDKNSVLKNYKFCYCFENFSEPKGWITEKIFDAMFAGCIPVYWGPTNIKDHIPDGCYIDASKLQNPAKIHNKLLALSGLECSKITDNIANYLAGDSVLKFSIERFVTTIVERVISC